MLADERKFIKDLALKRVLEIRQITSEEIRGFKVLVLNFDAEDYADLIDWKSMTEPPLTKLANTKIILDAMSVIQIKSKLVFWINSPRCPVTLSQWKGV